MTRVNVRKQNCESPDTLNQEQKPVIESAYAFSEWNVPDREYIPEQMPKIKQHVFWAALVILLKSAFFQ